MRRALITTLFGLLLLTPIAKAEIVANLGVISPGPAEAVACNQTTCLASQGTAGSALPGSGAFQHFILFQTSVEAGAITSTQILDSTKFDVADLTVKLHEIGAGVQPTTVGTSPGLGALLATATGPFGLFPTANFLLTFAGLDPAKIYVLEILGADQGVLGTGASYAQQISITAVPLPAGVLLLGAILAGMGGYARMRRRREAIA